MPRDTFGREIEELRRSVLLLGQRVRMAVDDSVVALREADLERARMLTREHQQIVEARWAIEGRTIVAVAEQSPVARDCRYLVGFLEILADLARIADHARGIAEINLLLGASSTRRRLGFLPSMADKALAMLDDVLVAFREDDVPRARHVLVADDDLDRLQDRVYSDVFRTMIEDPSQVQTQTYLLWVAHNLERVGDRATNVGETVIFAVTGTREYADTADGPTPGER